MDDFEQPIHDKKYFYKMTLQEQYETNLKLEIGPDKFIDNDDLVGLINSEAEPYEFMTIKKDALKENIINSDKRLTYIVGKTVLPKLKIEIVLSDSGR